MIYLCYDTGKMSLQALETSSTWVLGFQDEDEKFAWLKGLIQATYQASVQYESLFHIHIFNFYVHILRVSHCFVVVHV